MANAECRMENVPAEPRSIVERSYRFAIRIVKLVRALPRDSAGAVAARQLARCGTGIGANIEEAQDAHTKKEFIRKMNIARAEAREALYWLRLARDTNMLDAARMGDVIHEADEIVRVLVAIVRNARRNAMPEKR
jgi:four helix bundle protein